MPKDAIFFQKEVTLNLHETIFEIFLTFGKQTFQVRPRKLFLLLPDGVGLRNFAFTSFVEMGKQLGWEVVFWNHTPFDLTELGFSEIKLEGKPLAITDILKRSKISAELDHFTRKFQDTVYQTYKFPSSKTNLKQRFKNSMVSFFAATSGTEKGLQQLRNKMKKAERNSAFYKQCREVLEREKPDFVFCTNQRPVNAIAPLTAAQDLGIPTGSFIFSWDNLPKATMVVEPDHYFVWSDHMKQELLKYYPSIPENNIFITGSPQFEPHFNLSLRKSREEFYKEHNLDSAREYLCFSGDDSTTSPDDPQYLADVAEAVLKLNSEGENLGIIFRRCPVDFSDRYDDILEKFRDVIAPIAPQWKKIGGSWNAILPTKEDLELQINTIQHSQLVINLASSMVFDFALFNKPCLYLNYEVEKKQDETWSPQKVYNFVHFRSMPSQDAVLWLNSREELPNKIKSALEAPATPVVKANEWFHKINNHPAEEASERIWRALNSIVE